MTELLRRRCSKPPAKAPAQAPTLPAHSLNARPCAMAA
jgi:hypothetical protein